MDALFKTILSHPLVSSLSFLSLPLIIITCVERCVQLLGWACGDNQQCALMSKLFTFRSRFLWSCSVNWGILTCWPARTLTTATTSFSVDVIRAIRRYSPRSSVSQALITSKWTRERSSIDINIRHVDGISMACSRISIVRMHQAESNWNKIISNNYLIKFDLDRMVYFLGHRWSRGTMCPCSTWSSSSSTRASCYIQQRA